MVAILGSQVHKNSPSRRRDRALVLNLRVHTLTGTETTPVARVAYGSRTVTSNLAITTLTTGEGPRLTRAGAAAGGRNLLLACCCRRCLCSGHWQLDGQSYKERKERKRKQGEGGCSEERGRGGEANSPDCSFKQCVRALDYPRAERF